jgi:stress-induced-phosphoprotein 1
MEKKDKANQYFKDGDYEQSIKIYSEILETDENNYTVLSNRSAAYIKLAKYDLALLDAIKTTKLKPEWGKAWGRLGGALYGQDKFDESLVAYNKANELEPSEIYTQMMDQIKEQLIIIKSKLIDENINETVGNPQMNNLFSNIFDSVISNPKIMEKLTDPEFQGKVLSLQHNPMEAMKDREVMSIMNEMMKNMNL